MRLAVVSFSSASFSFAHFASIASRSERAAVDSRVELFETVVEAILLILLALHDLPLNLEKLDPPSPILDLRGSRMLRHRDARTGGIQQADRFVRKLASRHVPLRELDGSHHRLVQNDDVMVLFHDGRDGADHGDGFFRSRFIDIDRLEPARESRILFEILAILGMGGRCDRPQPAPR